MINLVTVVIFVGIVCFVLLCAYLIHTMRQAQVEEGVEDDGEGSESTREPTARETAMVEGLAGQLPQVAFDKTELDKDLRRGGYYKPHAKRNFLAFRNALVILVVIVTGVLAVIIGPGRQDLVVRVLGIGLLAAISCWALPRVALAIRARRRVDRVRRALPDALDMVAMCLRGGLGLLDSLMNVSREIFPVHRDLAVELLVVRRQADMNSPAFAFQQFADRIDCPETLALSSLVDQNQRLGTNVADSVADFADTMRLKWRQAADARSGRAQLNLMFPVVLCLLPSLLILMWGPAALELFTYLQGLQGPVPGAP
jgi:tight adherence protein C